MRISTKKGESVWGLTREGERDREGERMMITSGIILYEEKIQE